MIKVKVIHVQVMKANRKGNKYKYIGGGLLDEPGKPGRRDCCLLRLVAN